MKILRRIWDEFPVIFSIIFTWLVTYNEPYFYVPAYLVTLTHIWIWLHTYYGQRAATFGFAWRVFPWRGRRLELWKLSHSNLCRCRRDLVVWLLSREGHKVYHYHNVNLIEYCTDCRKALT